MVGTQTIVQELLSLQNCITPLLNNDNRCMSWKYPNMLASQVVVEDSLAALTKDNDQQAQVQGLELLVDRLVLIFKLSVSLLEKQQQDFHSLGTEVSISSVVQTFLLLLHQQQASSQDVADDVNMNANAITDSEVNSNGAENQDSVTNSNNGPKLRNRASLRSPLQNSVLNAAAKADKQSPCPTCGLKPQRGKKFSMHTCSICQKEFRLRKYLTMHLESEHKEDSEENEAKELEDDADEVDEDVESLGAIGMEEMECKLCDMKFLEERNLRMHVRTKHQRQASKPRTPNRVKMEPDPNGRFKCSDCEKSFKTARNLQKHSQIHSGNFTYTCKTCGKGYYNIGSFRAHESTHTGQKYFMCTQCGKGFPHSSSYNFHIRTAHTTEQNYECEICNRKYKSEKYLKDHIRSVHDQPDRYVCSVCSRTFGHRASLFMHMKTHRKEEPRRNEVRKAPKENTPGTPPIVAASTSRDDQPMYKQLHTYQEAENRNQNLMNNESPCVTVTPIPADVDYQQQQTYIACNYPTSEPAKELTNNSDGANVHILLPQQTQDKFIAQPPCSGAYSVPPSNCVYPTFPWGGRERDFGFAPNSGGIGRSLPPVSLPPIVSSASNNVLPLPSLTSQYGYPNVTMASGTVLSNIYAPMHAPPHDTSATNSGTG